MKPILNYHLPKWVIIMMPLLSWILFMVFYLGVFIYLIYRFVLHHEAPVSAPEAGSSLVAYRINQGYRERKMRFKRIVFGK